VQRILRRAIGEPQIRRVAPGHSGIHGCYLHHA
jgi:hypothetical protein